MPAPCAFPLLQLPSLRQGTITCIGMLLDGNPADWVEAAAPFVTESERAQARRFLHVLDAARHLLGRALVRRVLCAATGLKRLDDFPRTRYGKPVCPDATRGSTVGMDFSISHSGDMVWAAFCQGASVGIDMEHVRPLPDIAELAEQLHPLECAAILAQPEPERTASFHRCWTRKEAVLKTLGRGLSLPLNGFQVRPEPCGSGWLVSLPGQPAQRAACPAWTTWDIDAGPDRQCSVAASEPALPLKVFFE